MKVLKEKIQAYALGQNCSQEVQEVAEHILNQNLFSRFNRFAFYYSGQADADLIDCLLDFSCFGAELKIEVPQEVHPFKSMQFFGMTPEESLSSLFDETTDRPELSDIMEGCLFMVAGSKRKYVYSSTIMHYCFAKGRISVKQALDIMASAA